MLQSWFQTSFPSKPPIPGFRYKQTAVTFINDASATYDVNGYVTNLTNTNNRFGDACTVKYTVDPLTKGDIFAVAFTRTRDPSKNTSSNIYYQAGSIIANVVIYSDNRINFGGTISAPLPIVNNRIDFAIVLNMSTKTAKLFYSLTVGGPKVLHAEKPFTTQNVNSNLIQLYVDAGPSQALNVLAYNNAEFTL